MCRPRFASVRCYRVVHPSAHLPSAEETWSHTLREVLRQVTPAQRTETPKTQELPDTSSCSRLEWSDQVRNAGFTI